LSPVIWLCRDVGPSFGALRPKTSVSNGFPAPVVMLQPKREAYALTNRGIVSPGRVGGFACRVSSFIRVTLEA
jgi:hypothetical protein